MNESEADSDSDSDSESDLEIMFNEYFGVPSCDRSGKKSMADLEFLKQSSEGGMIRPDYLVMGRQGRGQHLDNGIIMAYRDAFMLDRSEYNHSFDYMTGGKADRIWMGPILLYSTNKVVEFDECHDLHASDLTISLEAITHFKGHLNNMTMKPREKIIGVKVNPSAPYFEEVKIPLQHPIFSVGATSEISQKFFVPLRTYISKEAGIDKSTASDNASMVPAAYLHTIIDSKDSHYTSPQDLGKVPQGWMDSTRSVLVA